MVLKQLIRYYETGMLALHDNPLTSSTVTIALASFARAKRAIRSSGNVTSAFAASGTTNPHGPNVTF